MTPYKQLVVNEFTGDCFRTCIACLIDTPPDQVPNFKEIQETTECYDMVMEADKWLRANHNKRLLSVELFNQVEGPEKGEPLTTQCLLNRLFYANQEDYLILSGESPRKKSDGGKRYHAVIGRADCWGFEVVHDPHPEGTGIIGQPYGLMWMLPLG